MYTGRSEWEEEKEFTADQVRDMDPKKYRNLFTSVRWSNKDPKDSHILALVGAAPKIEDDSNKSSDKFNTLDRESTKGEPAYTSYLKTWMLEEPTCVVGNKTKDAK